MSLPISNTEHVYRQLRHEIITGGLAQGERLLIRGLCEQFGTSNSPVIEAIRRLEQEGLVVSRPNAGAQVQEWSLQDVVRSYLVREMMDGVAARLFAEYATAEQRDELVRLTEEFRQTALNKGTMRSLEADAAYHLHVISATLPLPIQKTMESVYAITMAHVNNARKIFSAEETSEFHDHLTAALLGSDPEEAEKAARDHARAALNTMVRCRLVEEQDVPASIKLTGDMLMEV
jgi:DNA-binding GntR family transcriptional regulator